MYLILKKIRIEMYVLTISTILLVITQVVQPGNILQAPSVISSGGAGTIYEGIRHTLFCVITGQPQPSVSYKKDGVLLAPAENRYYSEYIINSATLSDSGQYTCEGVNSEGTASETFRLTVEQRPAVTLLPTFPRNTIRTGPVFTTVPPVTTEIPETRIRVSEPDYYENSVQSVVCIELGRTLRLLCEVTSSESYQIEWYKDGVQISGEVSATLMRVINNRSDLGSYTCAARTGVNRDYSIVTVSLGRLLSITRSPTSTYYYIRSSITLRVALSTTETDYTVTWYRNEGTHYREVETGNGYYLHSRNKRLDINPLSEEQPGSYRVQVTGECGEDSAEFDINLYAGISTPQNNGITPYVSGGRVELPCAYYGHPTPEVTWLRNNVEIDPSSSDKYELYTDNTLHIRSLDATDDRARITCLVTQGDRRRSVWYELGMGSPPVFTTSNCDASICAGESLILYCGASYAATYAWYKGTDTQNPLSTSSKYLVYSNGRLQIQNPDADDVGTYYCQASNQYGRGIKVCVVDTDRGLSFLSTERNNIVTLGRSFSLRCEARGSVGTSISWHKDDNRAIPSDIAVTTSRPDDRVRSVLSISSVTPEHNGSYTCTVSSCGEVLEQTSQLRARQNVDITNHPSSHNFCSGNTVIFICEATGYPTPVISWSFNSVKIRSGVDGFQIDTLNRLSVIDGPVDKTGYYKCNASNPFSWRTYGFTATFQETFSPVLVGVSSLPPVLNQDYYLSCRPTVSQVRYTYKWYRYNSLLSNSDKYNLVNEWQLCISNFAPADLGSYRCVVTNCVGSTSQTFDINTYEGQDVAPEISTTRAQYTAIEDRAVRLFCAAIGTPDPVVTWWYDDVEVSADTHYSLLELPNLLIQNVQRGQHDGSYKCVATNPLGSVELTINLEIDQPPKLDLSGEPISRRVDVGTTVCLDCPLLEGYPVPTVTWTRNGVELSSEGKVIYTNNTLCISAVGSVDEGIYRCTARNSLGYAYAEGTLRVSTCGTLNFQSTQLDHTQLEGSSYTLTCPLEPNAFECTTVLIWKEFTLGTDRLTDISDSDPRLVEDILVLQLDRNSMGLYQCIAYNRDSTIAQTHNVTVASPPWVTPFVSEQIFRVNSDVNLYCPIDGVPPPSYVWLLDGVRLRTGNNLVVNGDKITINTAVPSNTGSYQCRGSNAYGQREVSMDVTICAPMSIAMTGDQVADEKVRIKFECSLSGLLEPNSIEFLVGLKRVDAAGLKRFRIVKVGTHRARLIIKTRVEDTGPITCRINTTCGTAEITRLLTVNEINEPLQVIDSLVTHPGRVVPNCHNEFTLKCPISGKPKPTYVWYFNDAMINFKNTPARGKKQISVHDPDINDAGRYKCDASNLHGRISYTYIIHVLPPVRLDAFETHTVFEGERLTLECNSTLIANRAWSKNYEKITDPVYEENDLVIAEVDNSDVGVYLCCANAGDRIYTTLHNVTLI